MRVLKSALGAFAVLCSINSASADTEVRQPLTFDQIKAKCDELAANPQTLPFKAVISCAQTTHRWVAIESGELTIPTSKQVTASVQMKSFFTPKQVYSLAGDSAQQSCPKLQKVSDTVANVDVELNCAELSGVNDLAVFCQPQIKTRIQEDPSVVTSTYTNEILSLCAPQGHSL